MDISCIINNVYIKLINVRHTNKQNNKDNDSSNGESNSSNVSSNGEIQSQIQAIDVTSPPRSPQLQNMDTVDDIDEDEAFINELMALHPNDEDLIVEDIEFNNNEADQLSITQETVNDNNSDDGVRAKKKANEYVKSCVGCFLFELFLSRSLSLNSSYLLLAKRFFSIHMIYMLT